MTFFRNTSDAYGLVVRVIHWAMALVVFGLFGLGLWMRSLDYYSPWYQTAPDIHKSIGMILLLFLCFRLTWRIFDQLPSDQHLKSWERLVSKMVHWCFYALLFAMMFAGYLIATVDGRAIDVFGFISVPPIIEKKGLEDLAGLIHEYLAYGLMALAALHAGAALKHHFLDHDITLKRMWFNVSSPQPSPKEEKESP